MLFGFQFPGSIRGKERAPAPSRETSFTGRAFLLVLLAACAASAVSILAIEGAARAGFSRPVAGTCAALSAAGISTVLSQPIRKRIARLEQYRRQFDLACLEFVETMAHVLEARDPYTAGHSNRVRDYSIAIARAMRLPPEEIEIIRVGAQMHDIGKIGIPDAVLQKPGYLTPDEYDLVKLHPMIGKRILESVGRFEKYLPIVQLHHEDQDGGGYPYGLKGSEVPLAVRIVHVADVFDALTSNRAYRDAMPLQTAHEIIELSAGTMFDPEVVRAFSSLLNLPALPPGPVLAHLSELVRN